MTKKQEERKLYYFTIDEDLDSPDGKKNYLSIFNYFRDRQNTVYCVFKNGEIRFQPIPLTEKELLETRTDLTLLGCKYTTRVGGWAFPAATDNKK